LLDVACVARDCCDQDSVVEDCCTGGIQVRFELVSEEELEVQRKQFASGQLKLKIEHQTFSMK
jgi:hypothetical protein